MAHKLKRKKLHVDIELAGTITSEKPKGKGWGSIGMCCDPETGKVKEYWVKHDPPAKRKRVTGDVCVPDD